MTARLGSTFAGPVAALLLWGIVGCDRAPEPPAATGTACGAVTVANMNWQSAEVLAHIDAFILTHGYGCRVTLVPGDTMPTLTSMMEKGEPDVAPEAWVNAMRVPLDAAVSEGRLHYGARALTDGGLEGWWIPRHIADAHPEIRSIDDALKRPDLFPAPDDPRRGAVYNCPAGWNCQITTQNAFKAWNAAARGFDLVDTGSAAGLDGAIARAHERKTGWLGYYWAPTSILGRYPMVKLDAGVPHDAAAWQACNARADCQDPVRSDWARAEVFTLVTDRFRRAGGPALDYLNRRGWDNPTVQALMAWMSEQQASGDAGARHFLTTQPAVWQAWVSPDVAAKVKAAL